MEMMKQKEKAEEPTSAKVSSLWEISVRGCFLLVNDWHPLALPFSWQYYHIAVSISRSLTSFLSSLEHPVGPLPVCQHSLKTALLFLLVGVSTNQLNSLKLYQSLIA